MVSPYFSNMESMDKIQAEINKLEALDRSQIAKGVYGVHAWFEDTISDLKEALALKNERKHLLDLYNDKDWMLQTGLGDIEHEQFMYDQLSYGKPAAEEITDDAYTGVFSGFPETDTDLLALEGMRNMQGNPNRYLDYTPYSTQFAEMEDKLAGRSNLLYDDFVHEGDDRWSSVSRLEDLYESGSKGRSGYLGLATRDPDLRNIDLNLDMIMDGWEKHQNLMKMSQRDTLNPNEMRGLTSAPQGPDFSPTLDFFRKFDKDSSMFSLQNAISDIYRHEYGHLNPKLMGNRFEHPVIYANQALKGQYLPDVLESAGRFGKGPQSYGETYGGMPARMSEPREDYISFQGRDPHDIAGDVYREVNREVISEPPRKETHHFSTGGIVSLMV